MPHQQPRRREVRVFRIELLAGEPLSNAYGIDLATEEVIAFVAESDMLKTAGLDVFRAQSLDRPEMLPMFEVTPENILGIGVWEETDPDDESAAVPVSVDPGTGTTPMETT